ncbi:MAG: 3-deoxy-manno-octulosonate cytidylyltransferase [Alphaproteobacteria bacterium]|nr:3-deoxy-manno-octulosonate cytidylyltransferase [Alphaproteobacteria bacterium]
MSTNPIIVIPARMDSQRLPGKPLADIHGEPMIAHVWQRAVESGVGPVLVACADADIAKAISAIGGEAVMTRPDHVSGSDRVFEAVRAVDPDCSHDAVINLQGDLPTIADEVIAGVLRPLDEPDVDIGTVACKITEESERDDPNVVKAVVSFAPRATMGRALYFTRAMAPSGDGPLLHHIGVYAFRRAALQQFVSLPPAPLEAREKLEQLRALEAGMRIDVALVDTLPLGVDTPADLERARAILAP